MGCFLLAGLGLLIHTCLACYVHPFVTLLFKLGCIGFLTLHLLDSPICFFIITICGLVILLLDWLRFNFVVFRFGYGGIGIKI